MHHITVTQEYGDTGVRSNQQDLPTDIPTVYQLLRDSGYHVMLSGKDDLVKPSGCGVDGEYRASQLGFSDTARCKGKGNVAKHYPKVTDPYGLFLEERGLWEAYYECTKGDSCCDMDFDKKGHVSYVSQKLR